MRGTADANQGRGPPKPVFFSLHPETSRVDVICGNILYLVLVTDYEHLERTARRILVALSLKPMDIPT